MRRVSIGIGWVAVFIGAAVTGALILKEAFEAEEQLRPMHWTTSMTIGVTVTLATLAAAVAATAAWSQGWADRDLRAGSAWTRWGIGLLVVGGLMSLVFMPATALAVAGALVILVGLVQERAPSTPED